MSINTVENNESITKLDIVLEKNKITDEIIDNINKILTIENIDSILLDIEKFRENGKNIYKKYGTDIENKEKILDYIFKNISKLLNNVDIKRIHNSTSSLSNMKGDSSIENQLKEFVYIDGTKLSDYKSSGASCNNWVMWAQGLIENITGFDSDIVYDFQINIKHNHGLMYITIGNKRYIFDSNGKGLIFDEIGIGNTKEKPKYKPEFFDNKDVFKETFIKNSLKKNIITYDFDSKKLKIIKKYGILTLIYRNKPLDKLGKLFSIKYLGLIPKLYNIEQIREFIISKVSKEDMYDIKIIISKIHDEKLLQFFNLSKRELL